MKKNIDETVVSGFGSEWTRFDHSDISPGQLVGIFEQYFRLFPWDSLPENAVGFDLGCGTGRWARFVAPRVGTLHCVEPSAALTVARKNLQPFDNCVFHETDLDSWDVEHESMDFGYALGVLHHMPDTRAAVRRCVEKLKPGAPLLLYLYYAFDNRPWWFRGIWRTSDLARRSIARFPTGLKNATADAIALSVYLPLARVARTLEAFGVNVENVPLSAYRDRSLYMMRTDALDRFGTRMEHRFTRAEVEEMMLHAGLSNVRVSDEPPYWTAVGTRHAS